MSIDHFKEQSLLYKISHGSKGNYSRTITKAWHKAVPETRGYTACSMDEATHVVFSVTDLKLAGGEGTNFTANKVYSISRDTESSDFMIIDDQETPIIGFDLFIPCEYFKVTSNKVISMESYIKRNSK